MPSSFAADQLRWPTAEPGVNPRAGTSEQPGLLLPRRRPAQASPSRADGGARGRKPDSATLHYPSSPPARVDTVLMPPDAPAARNLERRAARPPRLRPSRRARRAPTSPRASNDGVSTPAADVASDAALGERLGLVLRGTVTLQRSDGRRSCSFTDRRRVVRCRQLLRTDQEPATGRALAGATARTIAFLPASEVERLIAEYPAMALLLVPCRAAHPPLRAAPTRT